MSRFRGKSEEQCTDEGIQENLPRSVRSDGIITKLIADRVGMAIAY